MKKRKLINKCECCGALFDGDTCEYCNARYEFEEMKDNKNNIFSTLNNDLQSQKITLIYGDKEIDFYVSDITLESFGYGCLPIMRVNLTSYSGMRDIYENNN